MHILSDGVSGDDGNTYVEAVLASLGEDAVARGVYPKEALREHFIKVERVQVSVHD